MNDYQADQLRRLSESCEAWPNHTRSGMAVSIDSTDIPPVWRELEELGKVKVATATGVVFVKPC